MLLFFVLSTFGTVMAGIFAPAALSLPLLGDVAMPATHAWGEVRIAKVTSNIRSEASTSSPVIGKLAVGDSVRVEPAPGGWFRVYDATPTPRSDAKPLGFVFGNLLDSATRQSVTQSGGDS